MRAVAPSRNQARARRLANACIVLILALLIASIVPQPFGLLSGDDAQGDLVFRAISLLGTLLYAVVGRVIVSRQPRNTIGWILLAIPLIGALATANGAYATTAYVADPGSLPFARASAWLDRWLLPAAMGAFIPIFLLFPDGSLPSRRWRPVLALTLGSIGLTVVSFAITPGRLTGALTDLTGTNVQNPLGLRGAASIVAVATGIGAVGMLVSAIASGISIVVRYRGADGEVRQQIRWLAFIGVGFLLELGLLIGLSWLGEAVGAVLFLAMFITLVIGIPLACGIAVLKYRLFELDVVVRKTVVFTLVAAVLTLLYLGVLALATVGQVSRIIVGLVLLAITFAPVRSAARAIADRVAYGKRATAYEVLTEFSERVRETYATEDVLPRMARVLGEGTGAVNARVLLRLGGELREAASFGAGQPGEEFVAPVVHLGEELGALAVTMPPNDPITPAREALVRDLAGQAGLVLRNVRLIEELRASRQRLVAAQDEERRKLERNLHDGAQQQLVALSVKLRLAEQLTERDPAKAREMLGALQGDTGDALENLRELARGIYPPLLADQGLGAALASQARKASIPVEVEAGELGRYARDVESAVYFCSLEALNNVAKYANATNARIRLAQRNGTLQFEVTDDGTGFDPGRTGYGTGLQGMADRLDAVGGTLEVRSAPGAGTTIVGHVPADPALAS